MLERLSEAIPRYSEILRIVSGTSSETFQTSVRSFYVDLFDFFKSVARVFTNKKGSKLVNALINWTWYNILTCSIAALRRTHAVIGQLFWQPFDVRFKNIQERFEFHQQQLDNEISILSLKQVVCHTQLLEEESKDVEEIRTDLKNYVQLVREVKASITSGHHGKFFLCLFLKSHSRNLCPETIFHRIKNWLRPPEFTEEFEEAQKLRDEGTAEWLFDEGEFKNWRMASEHESSHDSSESIFWVQGRLRFFSHNIPRWQYRGNPGCGKTILAASAVEEIQAASTIDKIPKPVILYFFFNQRSPGKSHKESAYRALLSQVLQQCRFDEAILDMYTFSMMSNDSGQTVASQENLHEILNRASQYLGQLFIVLDAVDECLESDDFLKEFLKIVSKSRTKLLVFSRPNVGILRRRVKASQLLLITRDSTKRDLTMFFTSRVQQLLDENLLPRTFSSVELVA
jgi:hypothetical protein